MSVRVGVDGMGQAIDRRLGSGESILLADFNETALVQIAERLQSDGFDVATQAADVPVGGLVVRTSSDFGLSGEFPSALTSASA